MKLAIVGSRSFSDYEFLKKMIDYHPCTCIISGGAKGADTLAKRYAVEHGILIQEFLPNWDLHGKSAGFIRNKQIVEASEELVAFWDKKSPGTKHSIDLAEQAGKPVYIYWPSEPDITEGIGI
jgi:predicted Rossmann fold nucleotide-binding protein DprA/Smf involved in DNA uptake